MMKKLACLAVLFSVSAFAQISATKNGVFFGSGTSRPKPNTLSTVTVTPNPATGLVGGIVGFRCSANYTSGVVLDETTSCSWRSANTSIATVGSSASPWPVTCVGVGSVRIAAKFNGVDGSAVLNCTNPAPVALVSIALSPSSANYNVGNLQGFQAQGTYADGSLQDISLLVTWNHSNTTNANTVVPVADPTQMKCLHGGSDNVTATLNGITSPSVTITCNAVLVSIVVTPPSGSANVPNGVGYLATGTYSDGTTQDVTLAASWSCSTGACTPNNPVIDPETVTCNSVGTPTVTATIGIVSSTPVTLTCINPTPPPSQTSVTLSPKPCSQLNGSSCQYTLTAHYSDGTTKDVGADPATVWGSGTPATVTMGTPSASPEAGLCIAGGGATSVITGTFGGFSDTATQTCNSTVVTIVSVSLAPQNPQQYNGSATQYILTCHYSDGSTGDCTKSAAFVSGTPGAVTMAGPVTDPEPGTCIVGGGATSVITATVSGHSDNTTQTCNTPPTNNAENVNCSSINVWTGPSNDGVALSPINCINTAMANTPAPGSTVTLGTCTQAGLQAALNALTVGQKLVVPVACGSIHVAGTPITLPNVSGHNSTHWNYLMTDQTGAGGFPPEGTRISPCADNQATVPFYPKYKCSAPAQLVARIICDGIRCFTAASGAGHIRFIGIKVEENPANSNNNSLIDLSIGNFNGFIFDRSIAHGIALSCTRTGNTYSACSKDTVRGFNKNNTSNFVFLNSWGYDFICPQGTCVDAQVFFGGTAGNTEQVTKVYGSLLASGGEPLLEGGGGTGPNTPTAVPTDGEVRANHFFKPVNWFFCIGCSGQHPVTKNNGELKNGNRWMFKGNVFENSITSNYQSDQNGSQLLLTPKNQSSPQLSVTATSDGINTLTATSGTFPNSVVDVKCATANHCIFTYVTGGVKKGGQFQSWIDATHVTVSPVPAAGSYTFIPFGPGQCPGCVVTNVAISFNEFRNSVNGVQASAATSDGADRSQGIQSWVAHDNLFHGLNAQLSNGASSMSQNACFWSINSQANPTNIRISTIDHNTCASAPSLPFAFAGLDYTDDGQATTTDGLTGAYYANRTVTNNIAPVGGQFGYKSGTLYPGGALAGLKQQSCSPPVTGSTCTYTYSRNVLGTGLWTKQTVNNPFPSTNLTCPSATCFPSGTAFTSLFVSYNGPNGEPGFRGNYTLLPGVYSGQALDGKDIGACISCVATETFGVRDPTTLTAPSITVSTLPSATLGSPYSYDLGINSGHSVSASDMQVWTVAVGSLPPGVTFSRAGLFGGTPTARGTYTFTAQLMDGAQQYTTQNFTLQVN